MRIPKQALLPAALASLALAGCGDDDGDAPARAAGAPARATVDIRDFDYVPAAVRVRPGATVVFRNEDRAPHTATAVGQTGFDTGTLRRNGSDSVRFNRAGTYRYLCEFHAFMRGEVIVAE